MTAHNPINPLKARTAGFSGRPSHIEAKGEMIPTDLEGYAYWLNSLGIRHGRYVVAGEPGKRKIEFRPAPVGTEAYLREKGLLPNLKANRAA